MIEWNDFFPSFYPYRFTRLINGSEETPARDLDLDNDWWIIYAQGLEQSDGNLMGGHIPENRWRSDTRLNVVAGATIACATPLLMALFTTIAVFFK